MMEVKSGPDTGNLGPAELTSGTAPVGSTRSILRNGEPAEISLAAVNGTDRLFQSSWGCSWTKNRNFIGPTIKFDNCNGRSGTQKITGTTGRIWPLDVGKRQSWTIKGRNTQGGTWATTRDCHVVSLVAVTVPAGTFDTYKVVCDDDWRIRTWYYAPSIGCTAAFKNYHKKQRSQVTMELVSGSTCK